MKYELVIQNRKFWNQTPKAQFDKLKIKHLNRNTQTQNRKNLKLNLKP